MSHWTIETIPFENINANQIRHREDLFFLLTAGSFIEIASNIYSKNLTELFDDDNEVKTWLIDYWEPEEIQHGLALKRYVLQVWSDFDWDDAFDNFLSEIKPNTTVELLEQNKSLEMIGRCVVEIGTSSLYRSIYDQIDEPILKHLLGNIKNDEIRHYRNFYKYFDKYNQTDCNSKLSLLYTIKRRMFRNRTNSVVCALQNVFRWRYPEEAIDGKHFKKVTANIVSLLQQEYPFKMAMKMIIRPFAFSFFTKSVIEFLVRLAGFFRTSIGKLAYFLIFRCRK